MIQGYEETDDFPGWRPRLSDEQFDAFLRDYNRLRYGEEPEPPEDYEGEEVMAWHS